MASALPIVIPTAPNAALRAVNPYVRWTLTTIAIGFIALFILAPLANVFTQALDKGVGGYVRAFYAPPLPQETLDKLPRKERSAAIRGEANALKTRRAVRMTVAVVAIAVPLNILFGIAAAWLIARFKFRGRSLLISVIELPFSVSPVVAGLIFVLLFGRRGWLGGWATNFHWSFPAPTWRGFAGHLWPIGVDWSSYTGIIFTPAGMVLATMFVTFPFVARTLIPLMQSQGPDQELAALTLGARGWGMFRRVTLPNIKYGLLYGTILCTARAMGEFGAVYVVAGPDANFTIPLRVEQLWQEQGNNLSSAFAVASVLTTLSIVTLVLKVLLERKLEK